MVTPYTDHAPFYSFFNPLKRGLLGLGLGLRYSLINAMHDLIYTKQVFNVNKFINSPHDIYHRGFEINQLNLLVRFVYYWIQSD